MFHITSIDEDSSPRSLTFFDSTIISGPVTSTGPINLSGGALEIDGAISPSTAPLTVGTPTPPVPLNFPTLVGTGTIHRAVLFADSFSSPARSPPGILTTSIFHFLGDPSSTPSTPATLTLDSLSLDASTRLDFNLATPNVIGGPTNDLVIVNGNLTLAGTLYIATTGHLFDGTYTLFTYTGTLTNNDLSVYAYPGTIDLSTPGEVNLIVSPYPTPEPASLTLLAVAAPFFLKRRR